MGTKIGDNNKIKNANFIENADIKLEVKEKKEKSKDGFWKQVFVNIMSNFLWKVLGILFSIVLLVALAMSVYNNWF